MRKPRSKAAKKAPAREQVSGPPLPLLDLPPEAVERVLALVADRDDRATLRLVCKWTRELVDRGVTKVNSQHGRAPAFVFCLDALTRAPWRLQSLVLVSPDTNSDVAALLAAADWPTLHTLVLKRALGYAGVTAFATARWPCLRTLILGTNEVCNAEAAVIAAMRLPALEELDLGTNDIGTAGAVALAAGAWPKLRKLFLERNSDIGDAGAAALAKASWPCLVVINLRRSRLGNKGVAALARANWPALEAMSLTLYAAVTEASKARLAVAFPGAELELVDDAVEEQEEEEEKDAESEDERFQYAFID